MVGRVFPVLLCYSFSQMATALSNLNVGLHHILNFSMGIKTQTILRNMGMYRLLPHTGYGNVRKPATEEIEELCDKAHDRLLQIQGPSMDDSNTLQSTNCIMDDIAVVRKISKSNIFSNS